MRSFRLQVFFHLFGKHMLYRFEKHFILESILKNKVGNLIFPENFACYFLISIIRNDYDLYISADSTLLEFLEQVNTSLIGGISIAQAHIEQKQVIRRFIHFFDRLRNRRDSLCIKTSFLEYLNKCIAPLK